MLQCAAVCRALQCITVRCSVLQCVAMCCIVLQCVTVCCSVLQCTARAESLVYTPSVLQGVAVWCSLIYTPTREGDLRLSECFGPYHKSSLFFVVQGDSNYTQNPGSRNLANQELLRASEWIHASIACCSVLQCVAVCCSVLQCVAVCCSVLQCVAVCCSVLQCVAVCCSVLQYVAVCCNVSQCNAGVLQCVEVRRSTLECVGVCCSVSQCVAVCRSVLQCVTVSFVYYFAMTRPNRLCVLDYFFREKSAHWKQIVGIRKRSVLVLLLFCGF